MLREARPMWVKRIFWKMEDFAARAVQEFTDKIKADWKFTIF